MLSPDCLSLRKNENIVGIDMDWSDFFQNIIPVSGIISAIVLPIIPLVFVPVLDYKITQPESFNSSRIFTSDISITNMGGFAAKNVTVSIIAKNVSILDIEAEPYLPNRTTSFNSKDLNFTGRGFFVADKLLPHGTMILHATLYVPAASDSEKLIVYVQSDETVGYYGVANIIASYVVVALSLSFVSMYCLTTGRVDGKVLIALAVVLGLIVLVVLAPVISEFF